MYRVCTKFGDYEFPLEQSYTVYEDGVYFGSYYFPNDELICIVRLPK